MGGEYREVNLVFSLKDTIRYRCGDNVCEISEVRADNGMIRFLFNGEPRKVVYTRTPTAEEIVDYKGIRVVYNVNRKQAEFFLTDEGKGFNPELIPDPRCDENLYKTEGRGLFLMRAYMDVVEYNRKGNCVHMIKYKKKTQASG